MPLVILGYESLRVSEELAVRISGELPRIVAAALHVEGDPAAHLTPADVEVWIRAFGNDDKGTPDIGLTIVALDFPGRRANLDERRTQIGEAVKSLLVGSDRYLPCTALVLLCPGSYGTF